MLGVIIRQAFWLASVGLPWYLFPFLSSSLPTLAANRHVVYVPQPSATHTKGFPNIFVNVKYPFLPLVSLPTTRCTRGLWVVVVGRRELYGFWMPSLTALAPMVTRETHAELTILMIEPSGIFYSSISQIHQIGFCKSKSCPGSLHGGSAIVSLSCANRCLCADNQISRRICFYLRKSIYIYIYILSLYDNSHAFTKALLTPQTSYMAHSQIPAAEPIPTPPRGT
jgi:hypothetical protein